jgi:hypothetical protein
MTPRSLVAWFAGLVVVAGPVVLLGPAGLLIGAMAAGLIALDVLSRRQGFGFAHGFLGYRGIAGWPRGVQEDDDFQWRWTPTGDAAGRKRVSDPEELRDEFAATSRLRPRIRERWVLPGSATASARECQSNGHDETYD